MRAILQKDNLRSNAYCRLLLIAVFIEASQLTKAMIAYEKALQWRELMRLAEHENMPHEDIAAMAYRIAGMANPSFDQS